MPSLYELVEWNEFASTVNKKKKKKKNVWRETV